MKIGILTLEAFRENARKIGGRQAQISTTGPVHDPPDFLGIFLHPSADGRAWENDDHQVVVTSDQVRAWPLLGTVVFLGVCYGLENRAMIDALFAAGARAIIAGTGDNFGGTAGVLAGADVLAKALLAALRMGADLDAAWTMAQATVKVAIQQGVPGAEDAATFQLLKRQAEETPAEELVENPTEPQRLWRRLAGWIGGAAALIGLLVTLLFWRPDGPSLLTTFSSIPAPPGITLWEKEVYLNGTPVPSWWEEDYITVEYGDTLTISDAVTSTEAYTLIEAWNTNYISLTTYSYDAGSVTPGSGSLTWVGASGSAGITKTWTVTGSWFSTIVYEFLTTASGTTTQTVSFYKIPPTPGPTPTARTKPTRISADTLYGTPEVWITPYPTPYIAEHPIVRIFLPLVMRSYAGTTTLPDEPELWFDGPTTAFSGQALDYTLVVTGTGDGVHTIRVTLPQTTTLVSATPSGYTQSGYDPVILTWIEDDLATWDGTVRVTAPTVSVTDTVTAQLRVLWESVSAMEVVTTTVAP